MKNLTDVDVVNFVKQEVEKDSAFMSSDKSEYKAFLKGQEVGAARAMAFLRERGILKPELIEDTIHYCFA